MTDVELKKFMKVLRNENLKLTPQRVEIFREVCDSDEHREAEEIFWHYGKGMCMFPVLRSTGP